MNNQTGLDTKDIQAKLEEAISQTGRSMVRLKNEYHQLKVIMDDLEYELKLSKQANK
jgi:hypothetical protein